MDDHGGAASRGCRLERRPVDRSGHNSMEQTDVARRFVSRIGTFSAAQSAACNALQLVSYYLSCHFLCFYYNFEIP